MKIKAVQNFAHAPSKKSFVSGRTYDVTDQSAAEFIKAGLVEEFKEEKEVKEKSKAKAD